MTNHQNDERKVKCPVEGCQREILSRGIHLHVRRSSGDGHGPQGDVPESITFEDLDTVGTEKVEMDYPEERGTDNSRRRCPWCGRLFAGTQGVRIHLGQVGGRDSHPEDAPDQYDPPSRAETRESERSPLWSGDDTDTNTPEKGSTPAMIQTARIYEYLVDLRAEGRAEEAERLQDRLCGSLNTRKTEPRQALFEAILREGRSSISPKAGVDRDDDGIYVECQDAAALLGSKDARWLGNVIELASEEEDWNQKPSELIGYLRDGAKLLEGDLSSKRFFIKHEYPT